ncbi:C5a anaphylatoxin chemotactic receptor 1 [Sarotherodon galilaeus]
MSSKASSLKTRSEASCASSTGSAAAKARAKAEAAKARLSFAAKEMDLKVEKAQIEVAKAKVEASIEFLQHEKDVASAIAEAESLEAGGAAQTEARSNIFVKKENDAALQQSQNENVTQSKPELTCDQPLTPKKENDPQKIPVGLPDDPDCCQKTPVISPSPHANKNFSTNWSNQVSASSSHDARPLYKEPRESNVSDFIRYFARREIVATGLLQFNDKPQNFRAWKRSFENAITASEEMDLMLKWLGKESPEHAEQLRAIHINNPVNGLNMIWDRLEQCYGSAEVIEDALFKRIDAFPKISSKDFAKLRKFSDLLMEVQCAKAEGDLPGVAFLDTARGVNPIIQKLPFYLQERWITVGANYKCTKCVSFPPFSVLVDFVAQEDDARNDPSFNLTPSPDAPRPDKLLWRANRQKEISVHKTDVISRSSSDIQRSPNKAVDGEKLCPIHKKAHPLSVCRAFRMKTLLDRKTFLKENNFCFKCCASSSHIAKNCKAKVQCSECNDEKHCTALHPGPAPWLKETEPAAEHGGEPDTIESEEITSKCTQVCGVNEAGRSCSKICLVNVYPAGHPHQAVRLMPSMMNKVTDH